MLYHKALTLPDNIDSIYDSEYLTRLSKHAKDESCNDKYKSFFIPEIVIITDDNLIEVEINESGQFVKFMIRIEYDSDYDLCIVLQPETKDSALVRTAWLNKSSDNHYTLDESKYIH